MGLRPTWGGVGLDSIDSIAGCHRCIAPCICRQLLTDTRGLNLEARLRVYWCSLLSPCNREPGSGVEAPAAVHAPIRPHKPAGAC